MRSEPIGAPVWRNFSALCKFLANGRGTVDNLYDDEAEHETHAIAIDSVDEPHDNDMVETLKGTEKIQSGIRLAR